MYKGTGASPGIALGKALLIEHSELVIEKNKLISFLKKTSLLIFIFNIEVIVCMEL